MDVVIEAAVWYKGKDEGGFFSSRDPDFSCEKPHRRRLSSLGKLAFQGYDGLALGPVARKIPWVVACRHGDTDRMLRLVTDLSMGHLLSPTDFSFSTHNALVGMMSVEDQNTHTHSALAAGPDSLQQGLIEAYSLCASEGEACGFLYYDRPVVFPFSGLVAEQEEEVCLGLVMNSGHRRASSGCLGGKIKNKSIILENYMINPDKCGVPFSVEYFINFLAQSIAKKKGYYGEDSKGRGGS